jgi:hypothetical protein
MTIALRRIRPDDYDVIHDGGIVGRIYRTNADRKLDTPVPAGGLGGRGDRGRRRRKANDSPERRHSSAGASHA